MLRLRDKGGSIAPPPTKSNVVAVAFSFSLLRLSLSLPKPFFREERLGLPISRLGGDEGNPPGLRC